MFADTTWERTSQAPSSRTRRSVGLASTIRLLGDQAELAPEFHLVAEGPRGDLQAASRLGLVATRGLQGAKDGFALEIREGAVREGELAEIAPR